MFLLYNLFALVSIVSSLFDQENILISPIGTPLLADFGISLSDELTQTMTYNINGSHRYMARELIYSPDGTCYKHCAMTDMWSFGMVVYVRYFICYTTEK